MAFRINNITLPSWERKVILYEIEIENLQFTFPLQHVK